MYNLHKKCITIYLLYDLHYFTWHGRHEGVGCSYHSTAEFLNQIRQIRVVD